MNIKKGDKLRGISNFSRNYSIVGKEFIVGYVGDNHVILLHDGCPIYSSICGLDIFFEKVVDNPISVTMEMIADRVQEIINHSSIAVTSYGNCTIVTCELQNGFTIVESGVSFNEKLCTEACIDRIKDKIRELESYRLQANLYESKVSAAKV